MDLIRKFVRNPVSANLLMVLILVGGLIAALQIPRELFPEFSVDFISITVVRREAIPADIEKGIAEPIEEELEGMEGIEEITSTSREGMATILLELQSNADVMQVLDEVKTAVDQAELPEDAEDPTTVEVKLQTHVLHVAVAGDAPERTLREIAEEMRDEIADLPEVSQVTVSGVREYEMIVEVSEQARRRFDLSFADVGRAIRNSSFDLPAGSIKTRAGELAIRVEQQRYTAEEFSKVPVLTQPDGTIVRLGEIATVREGFRDDDIGGLFNGQRAALVTVFKTGDEDSVEIAEAVKRYIHGEPYPPPEERSGFARWMYDLKTRLFGRQSSPGKIDEMPEGITLETWSDRSKLISDRLDMLVRNGGQGLVLVFLILWLLLGARLSFWVAMGIPISILGTLLVLDVTGLTLNMMSMFALIMALGLIVDDAIVVGENVYTHIERGKHPKLAAEEGTKRVLFPVTGAVITTWLAFIPLLFIPGVMGRFIEILPICVIISLAFSLVECLLILPAHLAHSMQKQTAAETGAGPIRRVMKRSRESIDAGLAWFIDRVFLRAYRACVSYRYVVLVAVVGALLVLQGAVASGRIGVKGFSRVESDTIVSKITMPTGTPLSTTEQVARDISLSAKELNETLGEQKGGKVVQRVYAMLGKQMGRRGSGGDSGSHVAEVIVELMPSERRSTPSQKIVSRWRENVGSVPGALSVTFGTQTGGPGGLPLQILLRGKSTDQAKAAANVLKDKLGTFAGVKDIEDDALPGKMEMKVDLKDRAYSLGLNLRMLAEQLRDAFRGNMPLKIQRGRDEIEVMVRYPEEFRRSVGDVENLRIQTPTGGEVPFGEVARVTMQRGYTTLRRVGGDSVVTVSADVEDEVTSSEEILQELSASGFFRQMEQDFPGLKVDLRGQRQQIFESLDALKVWFPLALLGIYMVLATIFRSYVQPVIIMIAIPFGLMGAVLGHWLMGFDLTLLSMFGMVALTGIVVNDSLVLLDYVNGRIREGGEVFASAEEGARRRFRPILLTTVTTIAGMGPILLERSFQAQFLKPMVVSIAFGLAMATMLTLVVVPCLLLIGNDVRRAMHWLWRGEWVSPEAVVAGDVEPEEDTPGER